MSGLGILGTLAEPHEEAIVGAVYWDYAGVDGAVLVVFRELTDLEEACMAQPSYLRH
jgi:hypothetical protein